MVFPSSFPVDPAIVQKDAKYAADKAAANKYWNFSDKPREVTVQQLKAVELIRRAQELGDVIWHRSKGNIGHTDLKPDLARRSLAQVTNAIDAAKHATMDVNKNLANKFLNKATKSFNRAENMLGVGKSMTRGTRGGTLRRKHRKSVKRCKS